MQHVSEDNLPLKSLWKSQKAKRPTFLYGVNGRRRLVPDDDIMYTIKSSGDGDTLPLSSGQVHTVELPWQHGGVAVREPSVIRFYTGFVIVMDKGKVVAIGSHDNSWENASCIGRCSIHKPNGIPTSRGMPAKIGLHMWKP